MMRKYNATFKIDMGLLEKSVSFVGTEKECILNLQNAILDEVTVSADKNRDFRQILQIKGISEVQVRKHTLSDYIVYVALSTHRKIAIDSSESEKTILAVEQFVIENGFTINHGDGKSIRFKCFERDDSFGEECVLSFIEEELEKSLANRRSKYSIHKFDIKLLEASLSMTGEKPKCILNFPALDEALKDETSYSLVSRDSDSMVFHQIRLIKGKEINVSLDQIQRLKEKKLNIAQIKEDSLLENIVYVSFSTLDNDSGSSREVSRIVDKYLSKQNIRRAENSVRVKAIKKYLSEIKRGKTDEPEQYNIEQFIFANGFTIDYGDGKTISYKRFERSGSMAKKCVLSFVAEKLEEDLSKRIILFDEKQLNYGRQLSKWAAYKGLSMSDAITIEGLTLNHETVIVIKDGIHSSAKQSIKTAEEIIKEDSNNKKSHGKKEYTLKNEQSNIKVNQFDGAGFISFDYANKIESYLTNEEKPRGLITSFQFRLPFCKGMLHKVDFKRFFKNELNQDYIVDVWGKKHKISRVEIILTESQFKAKKWLVCDKNLTKERPKNFGQINCSHSSLHGCAMWKTYWDRFNDYDHKLCISNHNRPDSGQVRANHLNYQVLHTLDIDHDGFSELLRESMSDYQKLKNEEQSKLIHLLKLGENELPISDIGLTNEEDNSDTTDVNIIENEQEEEGEDMSDDSDGDEQPLPAEIVEDVYMGALQANPDLLHEQSIKLRIADILKSTMRNIRSGSFPVNALTLFFSPDLLRLLLHSAGYKKTENEDLYNEKCIPRSGWFYAPAIKSSHGKEYSIIRNPHVSRNEHAVCKSFVPNDGRRLYEDYLSHLSSVCMVNPDSCIAERLSGADYDGDIVKVIDNSRFIEAARNELPWIKIPDPVPPKSKKDAKSEEKEWQVCKDTFKNKIGIYSNYAFGIAARAYGSKSDKNKDNRDENNLNLMTILIGLEIDSAKTGVKPYIRKELKAPKEKFLYFKNGEVSRSQKSRFERELQRGRALDTDCCLNRLDDMLNRLLKPHDAKTVRAMRFELKKHITNSSLCPKERQKGDMLALALAYRELRTEHNAGVRFREPYSPIRDQIRRILEKQGYIEQGDLDAAEKLIEENRKIFSSLKTSAIYELYYKQRDMDFWAFTLKDDREAKLHGFMKAFNADFPENWNISFYTDFNYRGYDLLGLMLKNEMDVKRPKEKKQKTRSAYKKNEESFEKRLRDDISDVESLDEIKEQLKAKRTEKRFMISDKDLSKIRKEESIDAKTKFIKDLGLSERAEMELSKYMELKHSVLHHAIMYELGRRKREKALMPYRKVNSLVGANIGDFGEKRLKCDSVDKMKSELDLKAKSRKHGYIGHLVKACQQMALEICENDANMVVDLCLDSDINAVMPNNRFFWDIAGMLALENERFVTNSNYTLPELVDDCDEVDGDNHYEYMFKKYKIGAKIDD